MPAWPGGPCPECGDSMPANLVTCQTCRALLNTDLQQNFVDIPEFIPLRELPSSESGQGYFPQDSDSALQTATRVVKTKPLGVFAGCPGCAEELKIPAQLLGARVQCNHCRHAFSLDRQTELRQVTAVYVDCPHCAKRVRANTKYANQDVQCNHCSGELHIRYEP